MRRNKSRNRVIGSPARKRLVGERLSQRIQMAKRYGFAEAHLTLIQAGTDNGPEAMNALVEYPLEAVWYGLREVGPYKDLLREESEKGDLIASKLLTLMEEGEKIKKGCKRYEGYVQRVLNLPVFDKLLELVSEAFEREFDWPYEKEGQVEWRLVLQDEKALLTVWRRSP